MAPDNDDDFKPKLGRSRDLSRKSGKRYVTRVLNAVGKKNARFRGPQKSSGFTGRNIGRGNHTAAFRTRGEARFRQRRVVIKARFVKLAGDGFRKARAHLQYVQRDGVSQQGEPGKLYNAEHDDIDGDQFLEQSRKDRHQFRFIVSPEDASELEDMKIYTRDLMDQMETDLRTKLDWVAVDHHNTDHPHTHIIARGVADDGKDLIIAKSYMASGFRERASQLMTDELGPRQTHEIAVSLRREVTQNRLTSIDKNLLRMAYDGLIDMRHQPQAGYLRFYHTLNLGRLKKLQDIQLASQVKPGVWGVQADMESTLRDLGIRGDIIKTMHAEMARQGKDPLRAHYEIFAPEHQPDKKIIGRLAAIGLSDELNDHTYLVVDGIDGKTHYTDIGQADSEAYKVGGVVEITAKTLAPRKTDKTIHEIAKANNGLYCEKRHAAFDPKASTEFIKAHTRRLESLRQNNIARRFADGSWDVPDNYLMKVSDLAKYQARYSPVNVIMRSHFSLEVQTQATGATWLDRTLLDRSKTPLSNIGFGGEVENALKQRQTYLLKEGLAEETDKGIRFGRGLLKTLERRELAKVGENISNETGKAFRLAQKGDRIEGVYTKPVELTSGRYAIIEKSKEFNLVPWRSVLERARGQTVSGVMSGSGISWDIGKKRGIGIS